MWSLVQNRRIRKQVEKQFGKTTTRHAPAANDAAAHDEKLNREVRDRVDLERADRNTNGQGTSNDDKDGDQTQGDKGEQNDQKIRVQLTSDTDPLNPHNWPLSSRSKSIFILGLLIFTQAWAGAASSMGSSEASKEFGVSKHIQDLSTALYLLGIGSGSLFAGPLSQTVGRNPTYLVSTLCYLLFVLATALTRSFAGFIVCRYLVGLFSSATLSINGSNVGDQFRPVKRAFVFPAIAWANVAAPVIAPIAGGWIVDNPSLGWRWTEWVTLIISGFAFLVALLFLPETYPPLLLDWKAQHLRRVTGDNRYVSDHAESSSFLREMKKVLPLPAKLLAGEPVIAVLGGYLVLLYVLLFTFLSGFDYIFKKTYKLSSGQTGSCFAAIAAGATVFMLLAPFSYAWARRKTEHVKGAPIQPEFRLWPAIVAAPLLPISLFWLGWSSRSSVSIWSSLGACFVFGVALISIYVSAYEYIIDSYGEHAAIALASITMVRYLIAGGMVMAARPLYEAIGVHWTLTFLGSIAVVLAPAPLVFWWFGAKLRKKSRYAVEIDI